MSLIITITNDGTGSYAEANYDVRVHVNRQEIDRFRVHAHDRADGWQVLLACVSQEALAIAADREDRTP